jgi:hypothetical protein
VDDHKDLLDAIGLFLELRRANVLAATAGQDGFWKLVHEICSFLEPGGLAGFT